MEIETGIPLPEMRRKWVRLIERMKVLDSVILKNVVEYSCLRNAAQAHGKRILRETGPDGIRVWRVA